MSCTGASPVLTAAPLSLVEPRFVVTPVQESTAQHLAFYKARRTLTGKVDALATRATSGSRTPIRTVSPVTSASTSLFGSELTALSQRAGSYIISMVSRTITALRTLWRCPVPNIIETITSLGRLASVT